MIDTIILNTTTLPYDICKLISQYIPLEVYYFPKDIKKYIMDFIPYNIKYLLNKSYYNNYHKYVFFKPYDSYIRFIIRQNLHFSFHVLLKENYETWKKKKKFIYNKKKYSSTISYINELCIHYKSNICRNVLVNY